MKKERSFGEFLAARRAERDLSMGQVARTLGITVAYYSQVENDRVPPFPMRKVDYKVLAETLGTDAIALLERAYAQRSRIELDLEHANDRTRAVFLQLARLADEAKLTPEMVEQLQKVLEKG